MSTWRCKDICNCDQALALRAQLEHARSLLDRLQPYPVGDMAALSNETQSRLDAIDELLAAMDAAEEG